MIDPFHPDWQLQLAQLHASLPEGTALFMLIDGAFVPGLFRKIAESNPPILLFESLPGCNEDTRDVSPFLVAYDPHDQSLKRVLMYCDSKPMLSAIASSESIERLGQRLSVWCVVEADGHRFNFRYPDTRRLPNIIDVLTPVQRRAIIGSARSWSYIGRDGSWCRYSLEGSKDVADEANRPELSDAQFAKLIEDCEADEMWSQLQYRGVKWHGLPSHRHQILSKAIALAREHSLSEMLTLHWCNDCVRDKESASELDMQQKFRQWKLDNIDIFDEA